MRILLMPALLAVMPSFAVAAPLPAEVARMIEAAAETPGALATVAEVARRTHPESLAEIDAQVGALTSRAEEERIARITSLRFRDGWKGEGQAGGFISTGNSDDVGGSASLSFAKETLRWRHEIKMAGDYQRSDGAVSKERYFAGYAGQWKLNGRAYVATSLTGERDRFAGFRGRFTESVGVGYRLIDHPDLRLDLQAGPALRQTNYYDLDDEIAFSARFGGDLAWTIRPDLVFTQNSTLFLDSVSSSLTSSTALTTKLRGDLSARASFDIRVEAEPPADREHTDTTTRATLVYSF
jgi:putative salt-induced outer membrane protein